MAWLADSRATRSDNDLVRARTQIYDDVRTQYAKAKLFTTLWRIQSGVVRVLADYSADCVTDQPSVEVQVFIG